MAQFIQYLYEYDKGKKIRNLGFMKVERQMDKSVIRLYAKQVDIVKGILFEREDGTKYMATWEPCMEEGEYISPVNVICRKIRRQDLSQLPRHEWKLANNNFLLHGFYNYHHLLYIEEGDTVWIGVPGIFHEKEEIAAKTFGFSEFRRVNDLNVELKEEETNRYEDFGYWCRQVRGSSV